MKNKVPGKSWIKRIFLTALIVEITYVVLLNLALQLPVTQTLINKIKPEKFYISWENAWTWYPFRIHVQGAKGNGQARSQQWEFEAESVSASIDILPLIFKRVWINDVQVSDVSYFQRPRMKPDKDYSSIVKFFPPISGREIKPAIATPKKKKRAWHVDIDGIELDGEYHYWIQNFKGELKGSLSADLSVVSRGGLFSLTIPEIDVQLGPHFVNGTYEVLRTGALKGAFGLTPMVPKQSKGMKMLPHVVLDVDIGVDINSLRFIEAFTRGFNNIKIDGTGLVNGHLNMAGGKVLKGTSLAIDADNIDLELLDHHMSGDGGITIEMGPTTDGLLDLKLSYNDLSVSHAGNSNPSLTGTGLELVLQADGDLTHESSAEDDSRYMSLAIDGLTAPDLSLFQRYLPGKWPLRLYGGSGALKGTVSLSNDAFNIGLQLASESADIGTGNYQFSTNLDIALMVDNPSIRTSPTTISGSYIRLDGASLVRDGEQESKPWTAGFDIENGEFSLFDLAEKADKEKVIDLFKLFGEVDANQLLGDSNGSMMIKSSVSSLAWIGVLMDENYNSSTSGSGSINGQLNIKAGMPAVGTDLKVESDALVINLLDYVVGGEGVVVFRVEEGGEAPDWLVQVALTDGTLKRKDEDIAQIQDVDMLLIAHIEDMSFEKKDRQFELEFQIPSAHLNDMSVFNRYLPADSPLKMTRGSADIEVDIVLKHDDADGYIRLTAEDMEAVADKQSVRADFSANVLLSGGRPADMNFNISGTELRLDKVRVIGENQNFNEKDWSAALTLTRADTTWGTPLLLKTEAQLNITDSRPIVAMLGNKKDRPQWVSNMLIIEDVEGRIDLDIHDKKIVIPYAFIDSDHIDFGAKGIIDETLHNGILYARYKKLDLVVKISDGKKNIDLFKAKQKYDEYQVIP